MVWQVNIIPIIAKADTISKSELHKFKIKIMGELVSNGVQIYQFPTDDEAVAEINAVMNVSVAQGSQGSGAGGLGASTDLRQPQETFVPQHSSVSFCRTGRGFLAPASPIS